MLLTKKQKRVINLSLIIALIALLVAAMVVGIYCIIKFGKSETLSREQIDFAKLVNSSAARPIEDKKDLSRLPSGTNASSVRFMNYSYAVLEENNGEYRVISLATGENVAAEWQIKSVEGIYSNIAVVTTGIGKFAIDNASGDHGDI